MKELDPLWQSQLRLAVMSILMSVDSTHSGNLPRNLAISKLLTTFATNEDVDTLSNKQYNGHSNGRFEGI
jgi:hypothetical protein